MLKGLGGLGDMAKMMAQAKEMQAKVEAAQERVAELEANGEAGAGLVTCTITGKGEVKALNIDPSIFSPADKEVVEDLIIAALKDGKENADRLAKAEMSKVTEGLNLPEGMKLPF
ncbi:nucleoid-associated protein YbaB [Amylibacter marinus]|uniref:Nucleoid-associated protein GCM10007939_26500 n=1 Tax=Amylibacter marinus TaxID=1475483 RepID=A0ABQ5VYP5_9RHOB|nr:YbaB/EbfC family nucleoid-associated protein [Amylibacter marinus]GLQ36366.1 nucleoid-associated protein YbaB [Amylibacter marinus]